jgi:hypothetical protein
MEFLEDDKVYDSRFGNGVVREIVYNKTYSVIVRFESTEWKQYSREGKFFMNELRSLFHGHNLEVPEVEPVRSRWIIVFPDYSVVTQSFPTKKEAEAYCSAPNAKYYKIDV